ncbi:MAG TPA: glycosyltransferase [Anaerolineae bacterium]|nr:glycosyltransferase [Anaerolineae bacterium]
MPAVREPVEKAVPSPAPDTSPPITAVDRPDILYVGARDSVEEQLALRAGLPFTAVETGQLRGKAPGTVVRNLLRILRGIGSARELIRDFDPGAVLVTGGYVSVPVVIAARSQRRPVLIYLPDLTPGLAIRVLGRLATQVAVTFPETERYFPGKGFVSGYPVRRRLVEAAEDRAAARGAFDLDPEETTLLIFGGSTGARSINRAVARLLPDLLTICQVIHVSGQADWPMVKEATRSLAAHLQLRYRCFAYLHEKMAQALAAADLALSRAGAAVLGEYPALGLPSVLVPYPHAGRHQEANAQYLASRGAAVLVDDAALGERLMPTLQSLLADEPTRRRMRSCALGLARFDAAQRIGDALSTLARSTQERSSKRG